MLLSLAVVVVVVFASVVGTIYPVATKAREVAVLAQGQFSLPVPMGILATAPNVTWATISSEATLAYVSTSQSGSGSVRYDWALDTAAALPVQFVLSVPPWQAENYVPVGGGSFDYLPAGVCSSPCTYTKFSLGGVRAGLSYAWGAIWTFNYTVRLMKPPDWQGPSDFLEVDLSPAGWEMLGTHVLSDLGIQNATASELGLLQTFGIQSGYGVVFTTNGTDLGGRVFQYEMGPVTIHAGTEGNLSVLLGSSFQWSPNAWEVVSFTGTGANFTVREYMDLRFGTILLDVSPWSGV